MSSSCMHRLDVELTGDGLPPIMPPAVFEEPLTEPYHVDIKLYGFSRHQLEAFIRKSPIREFIKFDYTAQRPAKELFADFIKHFEDVSHWSQLHLQDYYVAVFILNAAERHLRLHTSLWLAIGNVAFDLPMDHVTAMAPRIFEGLTNVDNPGKYTKIGILLAIMENKDALALACPTGRRIAIRLLGHMLAFFVRKPFQAEQFDNIPIIFGYIKTINWIALMNFYHYDELMLKLRTFGYLKMFLSTSKEYKGCDAVDRKLIATYFKNLYVRLSMRHQFSHVLHLLNFLLCPSNELNPNPKP